jgi:hypothetical protein
MQLHTHSGNASACADAALREIAKRTFAELGKGRFAADMADIEASLEDAVRPTAGLHAREDDDQRELLEARSPHPPHAREDDDQRELLEARSPHPPHAREDDERSPHPPHAREEDDQRELLEARSPHPPHAREDDDGFMEVGASVRHLRG